MSLVYRHPFNEDWYVLPDGEWGNRASWRDYPPHAGVDYNVAGGSFGKTIRAIANGTIRGKGWHGAYGNRVWIEHDDGMWSHYAHMHNPSSKYNGNRVAAGDPIGIVGDTGSGSNGAHLHMELAHSQWACNDGNQSIDPIVFINNNDTPPAPEPKDITMRGIWNSDNSDENTRRALVGEFSFLVISPWHSIAQWHLFGVENVNQGEWNSCKTLVNLRRQAAGMDPLP